MPGPDAFCSPSTSASSLSALDAPQYPDPWGAPWACAAPAPYVQLPLADVETLPIQRPLLLHDAAAAKPLLYAPPPCDYYYPHAVYAPQAALQLQLVAPSPPVPVSVSVPVPPAPAEVPIVAPTPTHGYNKFDALLGFKPDDLLRQEQEQQPPAQHARRKRPLELELDAVPGSPRSKRARRSPPPREAQPRYAHGHAPPRARRAAAPPAPAAPGPDRAPAYAHNMHPAAFHPYAHQHHQHPSRSSYSYLYHQRPAR